MAIQDELKKAVGTAIHTIAEQNQIKALIGIPDGDGTYTLQDEVNPHRVWVTTEVGTFLEVANKGAALIAGLPVILEVINGDLTIIGVDHARAAAVLGSGFPLQAVAPHTHRIGYGLDDLVEEKRFEPGLLYAGDDLDVRVLPFWYAQDGYWPDIDIAYDVSASQPSSGAHRWVRVGFDPSGGTFEVANGAAIPTTIPLSISDIASITLSASTIIPIGAVKLDGDMTTWHGPSDFVSARTLLGIESGAGIDADAIHDNVAGEIAAIAEKVSPISGDLLLIEDSAASNVKKKVQIGNLPSGGGSSTLTVVNSSGAARSAGEVVLLEYDASNVYQAKTVTTEAKEGLWAVVVTGGANGANIEVQREGQGVTVKYAGAAPAKGEFLTTSTTAGSAVARSTMHPNVFGICEATGSGGEVSAQLITRTMVIPYVSAHNILRIDNYTATKFSAAINGAPAGATLTYAGVTGYEDSIVPDDSAELGHIILYNTDRGNDELYIQDTNTGTNVITFTANVPAAWLNGDAVQANSLMNTSALSGDARFFDIKLTSPEIPDLTRSVVAELRHEDSGTVTDERDWLHPWETNSGPKRLERYLQKAAIRIQTRVLLNLIDRKFCWAAFGTGSGTKSSLFSIVELYVAY